MAPRCATVVAWGSLDLCHPHHACLALSHQPRSCPRRPFHKATHRKSKTKEKSCVALGGVRPQKGAQPKQPLAKGIPLVWGRGRGSLAQALSMFTPSLDVQGVPSGRQREDEEAITPHPPPQNRQEGSSGPLPPNRNHTAAREGTAESSAGSRLGLVCGAPPWAPPRCSQAW